MRRVLIFLVFLAPPCHAVAACAESIRELRVLLDDPAFPLRWRETTMDDGKPLVLSISERNGTLLLTFVKVREGVWAEGPGTICTRGPDLEARFAPDKLVPGPAAHWTLRYSVASGIDFTMRREGSDRMKILTTGWSGTFAGEAH